MTTANALYGEPEAADGAMSGYRLDSILAACGREPAGCRKHGGDTQL